MKRFKYENLSKELPGLQCALKDAVQSDILEIKTINKECEKYLSAIEKKPKIKDAYYVVFSPYIREDEHKYEHYVFLNKEGETVCFMNGNEMELYGLLDPCTNLVVSEAYKREES